VTDKKKLIEVALPLDAINRESAREKTIRQGHPSTFHLWWARRPLAACRAVLFASLVDDPSSHPERFRTDEEQQVERNRLFHIIEDLVKWENTTNDAVLEVARREIIDSCGDNIPPILDPFCGGGSIPLEAQRLGLPVEASDLNPVASIITKALVEIPPRYAGRPPIHPAEKVQLEMDTWTGARGLAEDVRYYARWMRDEAQRRIGHLYPVGITRDGQKAEVIAWIWARTVVCPNPACGSVMPLLNSMTMCSRRGREVWLEPVPNRERKLVGFKVHHGSGDPKQGSVGRTGATCLTCGTAVPLSLVRELARAGGLGSQLVCTIAEVTGRRFYLDATEEQNASAHIPLPDEIPETELPPSALGFRVQNYGITHHWQLFTNRQLVTMTTFTELVSAARSKMIGDGAGEPYADAVATYLGLCIGRLANRSSSQCFWDAGGEGVMQVFARNALPMIWVYAEGNPFSDSTGNFLGQVEYLAKALERVPAHGSALIRQFDAAAPHTWDGPVLVCTDPPYYDNVPYADLSDFFYVWLRRCLAKIEPEFFSTILVPKAQELIAEPARHKGWDAAAAFFENGLRKAFENMLAVQDGAYIR
jgi:putative DNA methylase